MSASDLQRAAGRRFFEGVEDLQLNPTFNPYVGSHAAFGPEVIPAESAAGLGARVGELFGRVAPLHLEIGSGNGFYLAGMAAKHPEWDWVGVEVRYKRVELVARKLRVANLHNARIVRYDAFLIEEMFGPGSLAGLHVNHPDPWRKERHAKKRLVGPAFLTVAANLLAPGGELRLKTDFPPHIDTLLDAIVGLPFTLAGMAGDIKAEGAPWPDEVRTNYQRKAEERGVAVGGVWLRRT